MSGVTQCDVPAGSFLSFYGGPMDYRDCYCRDLPGEVTLSMFVETFYTSAAFLPERMALKLLTGGASSAHARAMARGITDKFGAWHVVERDYDEILLEARNTMTASWFGAEPMNGGTRIYFGSWVGQPERRLVKALMPFHRWYSRWLLRGV